MIVVKLHLMHKSLKKLKFQFLKFSLFDPFQLVKEQNMYGGRNIFFIIIMIKSIFLKTNRIENGVHCRAVCRYINTEILGAVRGTGY